MWIWRRSSEAVLPLAAQASAARQISSSAANADGCTWRQGDESSERTDYHHDPCGSMQRWVDESRPPIAACSAFFGTLRVIQCVHFFRSRALRPQRVLVTALSKHAPKLKGLIYRKENGSLMV